MVAAGISTLLMQSPALALERAKVLSIHNGQQLLIEVNGQGRTLRLACLQAPRSQQRPWSTRALVSFRSWFVLGMWATSSSERGTFTAVLWVGS